MGHGGVHVLLEVAGGLSAAQPGFERGLFLRKVVQLDGRQVEVHATLDGFFPSLHPRLDVGYLRAPGLG
ncbi:MAG: hypothetical protein ABSA67_02110 [Candidatus Brocadiia bacterium]